MPYCIREDPERPIPPVVKDVLVAHGWVQYDEEIPPGEQPTVSLYWKTNRFFPTEIQSMRYPSQRVNHYPRSSEITKKDLLYRHMRRMKAVHGNSYDFVPTTFALPTEYVKFCQYFAERREAAHDDGKRPPVYICKPSELSRGRKIFCFDDIGDLTYDCSSVVQSYINNPLLIHGHKTDFRIYVLVTSFKPLRAYIFEDGLARMSAEAYSMDDVKNIFAHLTNYSVNKNSEHWEEHKDGIGCGFKWDFPQTRRHFEERGIDFSVLFDRIECLVCSTLLSICNNVNPVPQCFELYGFDVLFDTDFKPWLMEVNFSPALAVESDVDARVKEPLIWDLVQTLGIPDPDEVPPPPPPPAAPTAAPPRSRKSGTSPDNLLASDGGRSPTEGEVTPTSASTGRSTKASAAPPTGTGTAKRKSLLPPPAGGASKASTGTGSTSSGTGTLSRRSASTSLASSTKSSSSSASARKQPLPKGGRPPLLGAGARSSSASRDTLSSKRSGGNGSGSAASSSVTTTCTFLDKAFGKFKVCFPFSDSVEKLNYDMMSSPTPEKQVRQIISEIRKRENKSISAIKGWTVAPDRTQGML